MILKRITLRSNIVYENIELLTKEEQLRLGINQYVPDVQVAFRCKEGLMLTSAFHIIIIQINTHQRKLKMDRCNRVERLTLSGDNVYEKLCVLDKVHHEEYGIPLIFKPPMEQFVFACNDGMFLANTFHILQIVL